ncbi:uncharacterized protein C4orf54 homolog [Amblyraja radiata]|uniref:uncharacterized protein C4orf54 homolog n=1 Tax=Amblyraja radiata TaxID=386614 RepID=UPI001403A5E0|nr:uncharacterized protein C4orf54 homolog [Amblyraja radiata]
MFQIEKDFGDHFSKDPRGSVGSACADYMSDTASLVSELDETDYEVRKLTALSFRSLACPHNNYIELSSSRASTEWSLSLSDDSSATNKWSTYAELSEANLAETHQPPGTPIRAASAKSEESREERGGPSFGGGQVECVDVAVETQEGRTVPKREIQFKKRERSELTFFGTSDASGGQDGTRCGEMAARDEEIGVCREDAGTEVKEGGSERPLQRMESTEECSKKAKLASCHISNVIFKKMQFEQELKMERGAVHEPLSSVPSTPSSVNLKEFEFPVNAEGKRRNSSAKPESDIMGEDVAALLRRRSSEVNGEGADDKRGVLRQDSGGSLKGEGISVDGHTNHDILDAQRAVRPGRAMGLGGNLANNQSETPSVRGASDDVDCTPPAARERLQTSSLVARCEDKANYKQSGSNLERRNVSRSISMPQPLGKTSASGAKHQHQVDPFGTVEQLAPHIGSLSKVIALDPKYMTLPASFKFETDGCRIQELQFKRRESVLEKTKGPIHQVRDVRKLVKNTYGALRFNANEAKAFGSAQVLQPNGSRMPMASDQTIAAVEGSPILPVYIHGKTTGWRSNSNVSVDKKYWTYAGSTDTSRTYSDDIKLLIPFNTNKSTIDHPQKARTETQSGKKDGEKECGVATKSTEMKNSQKKMMNDDELQIPFASRMEDTKVPPKKVNTSQDKIRHSGRVENQNSSLSMSNAYTEDKNVESIGANQNIAEKFRKDFVEPAPKKNDSKVPTNRVGSKREDSVKLNSEKKHIGNISSLHEDLNSVHGKADSKREIQNRPEHTNKLQKITISKNNDTKVVGINEPKSVENQNIHLNTPTHNINDAKLSAGKDILEKLHSKLDLQKTSSRMSSLNSEKTQELTGKGQLNKESQARNLGSKNNNSEYSVFKTEKIKGKDECGTEGQVKVEQKRKSSGSSMLNTPIGKDENIKTVQYGMESKMMIKSLSQTAEVTKLPRRSESKNETQAGQKKEKSVSNNSTSKSDVIDVTFGKYETVKDIQVRLENLCKVLGKSNEERVGKMKAAGESQAWQDHQRRLPGYCTETSESKSESKKENKNDSEDQVKNIEQAQTVEKSGLKMLKEPIKDSYVLSLILEEESKNNSEPSDDDIRSKHSSMKNQALNSITAQASQPSSISVTDKQSTLTVKGTNHYQSTHSTAKTSTHKSESNVNKKSTSASATNIPVSTLVEYQDTTSQILPSSAELKVKALPPINSVTRLFGLDQKQNSCAGVQSARAEGTQEHGSASLESVNYLAISSEERRSQVPNLGQTTTSPHSTAIKPLPYFQHQRSLELTEPPKQEMQSPSHPQEPQTSQNPCYGSSKQGQPQLSPCFLGTMPSSFVETACDVSQSQETGNPGIPSFQYPQTQKKMLVDPETGNYYYVDAPVQPSRRMLLDPVTGQYVEVVMSQQPFGGVYQVPFSPYILHPGVMGPSYLPNMPYPGVFVGPPVSSQRPLEMQSQSLSQQGSAQDKADMHHHEHPIHRSFSSESTQMETLYYIPTGMPLYPNPSQPTLQQVATQAKPNADVKDNKAIGYWPIQHTYDMSNYLPHVRPSSFAVE